MTLCDSLGLAALLMIHRHATEADTVLHLDNRPAALQRLLDLTGTAHLFTDPVSGGTATAGPGAPERADATSPPLPGQPS